MTRLSFVPVLLLLSACSIGKPSQIFQVSRDFSDQQMNLMSDQAGVLCDATDGEYCIALTRGDRQNKIVLRDFGDLDYLGYTEVSFDNGTTSIAIEISPNALSTAKKLSLVVRHEFGHAGGCIKNGHLPPGNVMTAMISDQSETWTADDLDCVDNEY